MTRKGDSHFVRFLAWFFGACGNLVCGHAWLLITLSCLLTAFGTLKVPLSDLSNKVSDFTPLDAPSIGEYEAYSRFFEDGSTPNTIYAFVSAKNGGSMFTLSKMGAAIEVLDTISSRFKLTTPRGELSFEEFCRAFCVINEPVRTFYNGMRIAEELGFNSSDPTVDISYPDTTVLGVKMHMDPNVFGVKIAVERDGVVAVVSPSEVADQLNEGKQQRNNLRSYELVVFNFKSELHSITPKAVEKWEHEIVHFFQNEFNSTEVDVTIFADSFITSEVVRSGLQLLPFLVIGFLIMVAFSAATFLVSAMALDQLSVEKMFLAVVACACPFMACGAGLGCMFWFGFRFGTILCVTPFLILAIGVDDAYLMVNAWQQITAERIRRSIRAPDAAQELRIRMREMLIETGPSISITTITNVCAFAISAMSGSPEIQLFSIGNSVCVLASFVFQLTIYTAVMVITGRREIDREYVKMQSSPQSVEAKKEGILNLDTIPWTKEKKEESTAFLHRLLHSYCRFVTRAPVAVAVALLLIAYLVFSALGTARIQPELRPEKLFLRDSPFIKLFAERQEFIIPHYSVAWIYIQNPGDIFDDSRKAHILEMVTEFESLPASVGRYSTKFFLRDFEEFARTSPDLLTEDIFDDDSDVARTVVPSKQVQLQNFLSWPENSYWRGFVQFEDETNTNSTEPKMTRFLFTTAYKGEKLKNWSNRMRLLAEWREVASHYPDLNVSVYQEDSKFLDIIDTMVPQSASSAILTIVCMFIVTLLFIPAPLVLFTATFSIISTSLGVFGLMSWAGVELDPIFMASMVMSIGFSVDIPAHIAYHYHQTAVHSHDVVERLEHTISRVGFPIMQASFSTILCVSSLFFIDLHMSRVFASTMLLVVITGTLHGLLVMPVIFSLAALLTPKKVSSAPSQATVAESRSTSTTTILTIS